jgi:Type II secretion system (T2SS), protein M subtype b
MNLRRNINLSGISDGLGDAFRRARLSPVEIVCLLAALVFGGFVAGFYFYQVQPLYGELEARKTREQETLGKLSKIKTDEQKRVEQTNNSEKILDSLSRFQAMLKPDERGIAQIMNEINELGKTHKVYAGDASYRVTDAEPTTDENGNPLPAQKIAEKKINIYPTLAIDTTVVGDYPNLRRFLADLERSRQFLIINSLAFQGGDDKLVRALAKGGKQIELGSAPGALPVSVKIGLDTYFQSPPSLAPQTQQTAQAEPGRK